MEESKGNEEEKHIENTEQKEIQEEVQYYPPKQVKQPLPKKHVPLWVPITLIVGVFFVLGGYALYIFSIKNEDQDPEGILCTQDVKRCPDGSFVSRIPPTCRFEACPVIENNINTVGTTTATSSQDQMDETATSSLNTQNIEELQ